MSAARRIRSSSPSGSTMWRRSAIASSRTWCSNISGVTTEVRATSSRSSSASPSTCSAKSVRAVAILRGESLSRRPRRLVSVVDVAWVPRSVAMIGSETSSPSRSRSICSGSGEPAVEHDAGDLREAGRLVGGEDAEDDLGPVAGRDDERAVEEPVEHVRQRHRGDHQAGDLARELALVAADEAAVARRHQVADGGGAEQRLLGDGVRGYALAAQRRRASGSVASAVHAVGDDREQRRVVGGELGLRHGRGRAELVDSPALAVEHQQDGCAEVGRDPGVERELRRGADVGVVAADDDHGVALLGDLVVARHDAVHRAVRVGVHVVVADAGALVVRQRDRVVRRRAGRGRSRGRRRWTPRRGRPAGRRRPAATRRDSCSSTPSATADLPVNPSTPAT